MRAIQTRYVGPDGTEDFFRSRQEARWAVFLDHLGTQWRYEYEGFDLGNGVWYLPDFWLPDFKSTSWDDIGMWLEVKGKFPTPEEQDKAALLCQQCRLPVLISWTNFRRRQEIFYTDGLLFRYDGNGVFRSSECCTRGLMMSRLTAIQINYGLNIRNLNEACNATRQARFGRDEKIRGYEHFPDRRERVYADH